MQGTLSRRSLLNRDGLKDEGRHRVNSVVFWAHFEKLMITYVAKKFLASCGTRSSITVFTSACHCPYSELDESNQHFPAIFLILILILYCYLGQGLYIAPFHSSFLTKVFHAFLVASMHPTCSANLTPL